MIVVGVDALYVSRLSALPVRRRKMGRIVFVCFSFTLTKRFAEKCDDCELNGKLCCRFPPLTERFVCYFLSVQALIYHSRSNSLDTWR